MRDKKEKKRIDLMVKGVHSSSVLTVHKQLQSLAFDHRTSAVIIQSVEHFYCHALSNTLVFQSAKQLLDLVVFLSGAIS